MKFSIVIALYNKASYIGCAIDSVLAQSFRDFEVIVVDDGSTDDGPQMVASITDQRLRLVRQANAGVSVARNQGIAMARGEWVAFFDADDWLHPAYLAGLLQAQQAHPDADIVATSFVPITHKDGPWPPRWPAVPQVAEVERITDLPRRWMRGPAICASATAVRTTRLKQMQPCFAPGESHGEDLDLWFRLAEHTPVALVTTALAAYRVSVKDSLTGQNGLACPPYIERMQQRAQSGCMTAAQRESALWFVAQHHVSIARLALTLGKRREGWAWLLKGRRAVSNKRWWLTAAMACFFSKSMIDNWEQWRLRRALALSVPVPDHDLVKNR